MSEHCEGGNVTHQHADSALGEMLFKSGSLNLKILGYAASE